MSLLRNDGSERSSSRLRSSALRTSLALSLTRRFTHRCSLQCTEGKVRAVAYECISQIGEHYYDKLADYITVLANLTFKTIAEDEERVATQAIEFWSTLCDEEIDILEEIEDCR